MNLDFEVIDDHKAMVESLKRAFDQSLYGALLVNCHFIDQTVKQRSRNHGLDVALTRADEGKPMIIYGFDPVYSHRLADDPRFVALMGRKHIGYIQVPIDFTEIDQLFEFLKSGCKPEDLLALELLEVKRTTDEVSSLKHDLGRALVNPETMARWLDRAQAAGFQGTQEEIVAYVETYSPNFGTRFAGQQFPGVFVDADGTLLTDEGQINQSIKTLVDGYEAGGLPVTVWTGGDTQALRKVLVEAQIPWKIVPKGLLNGAQVQLAIDDEPELKLAKEYGVTCRQYIRV